MPAVLSGFFFCGGQVMKDTRLTQGTVWKKLLLFALPITGANLLQAMYGTVDLMVVGLFADAAQVSAVSTGSMTMQTITGIITGLTMGCTVQLGHAIGMKDHATASRTVASSLALFVVLGLAMAGLIAAAASPIASVMNAPAEAMASTVGYIRICGAGVIAIVLFNAISGMFRGIGDSKTPLILMGIACAANILGDLLLVGVFHMGGAGAAAATIAAQGISVLAAALLVRKNGLGFETKREALRPGKKETLLILKYGLPIAAQEALTGVSFMVILAILNTFGLIASAGVGVAEKLCGLMFIIPSAMMAAVSAFSAQNIGAGQASRARQGMLVSMGVSFGMGLCMFLASFFHGAELAGLFTPDQAVCQAAADYLRSYSVDCVIVGFNFSMMGYLNGMGRTGFVALQGILSTFLVRIPVSWLMSKIPDVSLFQVGFATPLATAFAIVITVIYLRYIGKTPHQKAIL